MLSAVLLALLPSKLHVALRRLMGAKIGATSRVPLLSTRAWAPSIE